MKRLYYIVKKEILEIARDYISFMILIIMPVVFILIMSLSMQALFQTRSNFKINMLVVNHDKSGESKTFLERIKKIRNLSVTVLNEETTNEQLSHAMLNSDNKFGLVMNNTLSGYINDLNKGADTKPITLLVEPTIQTLTALVINNQIEMELSKYRLNTFFNRNAAMLSFAGINRDNVIKSIEGVIQTAYVYKDKNQSIVPNAAQQSVPAWLVFSMYFLMIPISSIFHTEKNNGTLLRLRSINVKSRYLIVGKIFSYYIISMIQVVCMLAVGRYIVPLLGGDTIQFGNTYFGLFLIATCISINAISYGLLMSVISKSLNVSTGAGIVFIIILSAIGGIMVPKFVMPAFLQNLSNISPLSWGMEGFLDIMLRNGTAADIMPECLLLIGTGCIMFALTGIGLKRRII
jgi:ABC-2 type transport system permease protein